MSSTTPIQTQQAPAAIGPYAQGRAGGGLVFVSGQLGLDPATGDFPSAELEAQTRQAMANLKAIVEAAGCTLNDVAAVDVFLTDMGDFAAFNTIYQSFFGDHKPARAVVAVKALPKGGRVEIKCLAVR
ncbi:MAG: RidA family protein [Desulfobacteraceae bacterium]|nr:RidA family protein [Desulfobacteraceae bacterium]